MIHLVPVMYLRKSVNNLAISRHSEVLNSSLKEDFLRHYLRRPLTTLTTAIQCAKIKYSNEYANICRPKLQSQTQRLRQFKPKSVGSRDNQIKPIQTQLNPGHLLATITRKLNLDYNESTMC